jgi:hypothetical protein
VGANYAETWTSVFDPEYSKDAGCGVCHIGAGPDAQAITPQGDPLPITEAVEDQIDCVVCHGATYDAGGPTGGRHVLTDENDTTYWSMASLADAQTVGDKVTSEACKRCHINTGGKVFSSTGAMTKAFKYGQDYVAEDYEFTYDNGSGELETATIDGDVHAAAGMTCAECHYEGNHTFKYGEHNTSWAHDFPPDTFNCQDCHGTSPHTSSTTVYADDLNSHTDALACQTCHITHTGGLMFRDLTKPVLASEDAHFYDFRDQIHYGVPPIYGWFNGESGGWEAVIEGPCPIGPKGSKRGNRQGDGSKITPFKEYRALVWFDLLVLQPVTYILKDFLVDGDLTAMICALKPDHGVRTGPDALGFATPGNADGCNTCHSSSNANFWKRLGYTRGELKSLQQPRTPKQ